MTISKKQQSDIPLPLALVLLAAVSGYIWTGGDWSSWEKLAEQFNDFVSRNNQLLNFSAICLAVNLLNLFAVFRNLLGFKKHGSRIQSLLPDGGGLKNNKLKVATWSLGLSSTYLAATYYDLKLSGLDSKLMEHLFRANLSCGVGFLASGNWIFVVWRSALKWRRNSLPIPDSQPNSIIIGTKASSLQGDETEAEWVRLSERSLNGNIFISGSIGSGKTQGAILPIFRQLLQNFEPSPAVLAVDPKGTFVSEALEIAKAAGKEKSVHHLTLKGSVRFNPIFHPNALMGARYIEIAQMIRAASNNFMGGEQPPFWDISSFNLIKNTLIYCAATLDYYTLSDLYAVVTTTNEAAFIDPLKKAAKKYHKNSEIHTNIKNAISYFVGEFNVLDEKLRTSILATATAFLNQFQEYQVAQIFCPKQEEITLSSMDEIVDEGQILLFDIKNPGLAKSMGTFLKLLYQQSILNRLNSSDRNQERCAALIIDEYQDVCTTGNGATLGDETFLAKSREAKAICVVATQGIVSIEKALGREKAARELLQNFRTRIMGHSSDAATYRLYQDLAGQEDHERLSHSISETSQDAKKNYFFGGFDSERANLNESFSKSTTKEYLVTGKEFSRLRTFESYAQIYDGVSTSFIKLFLKPYFLNGKAKSHAELMKLIATGILVIAICGMNSPKANAFPNVCDVVNAPEFHSCLELSNSACVCGFPPRPCSRVTYYVPETFVEVFPNGGETYFRALAGAGNQIVNSETVYGAEADLDTQSFHAHALPIPYSGMAFRALACKQGPNPSYCFSAMSEHLGEAWKTGFADMWQPQFLAWSKNPKACLLAGAAQSAVGSPSGFHPGSPSCSFKIGNVRSFPPSMHPNCTGWGVFFPRSGVYSGPSQTIGALMVASRLRSLGSEVFQSTPTFPDEKWQMIFPGTSQCFREGQNVGFLETAMRVNDSGRVLKGKLKGHLFAIWRRVSCCRDIYSAPVTRLAVNALKASCAGGLK